MQLTLAQQIQQQMALNAAQPGTAGAMPGFNPAGAPPPAATPHAPGYPHSAAAHIGAPVPTQGLPPSFPAAAPGTGGGQVPSGPFNPSFSFGGQAPQAPAPAPQPAPVAPPPAAFGTQVNAEYCTDGQGGYFRTADIPAMLAAGHPQALALWGQPQAPATVAPSPTPGLPPEAFAPGGPAGVPAPVQAPSGAPAPMHVQAPATPEGKRKRRTKAEMAADAAAAGQPTPDEALYAAEAQAFARDTDPAPAPSQDVTERIAIALENIAQLLGLLALGK